MAANKLGHYRFYLFRLINNAEIAIKLAGMKTIFYLLLVLFVNPVFSQQKKAGFATADRKARSAEPLTVDALAADLTSSCKTDIEKVRAIFRWITEHIDYNTTLFSKTRKNPIAPANYEEPDDTSKTLKPLTERVAQIVLQRRIAVCEGYAKLFKSLCDHAGIRSEIICGYAKTDFNRQNQKFKTNHSWNAVYVDSNWHLLDVTWASGFVTYSTNEFIRSYDDYYFFTPPQYFIRDHYPEDLQWTLLTDPPAIREFYQSPFRYTAFIKQRVTSFLPAKGIIEAAVGDTIRFEVETEVLPPNLFITNSPGIDTGTSFPRPLAGAAKKAIFTYTIPPAPAPWLYVISNGEVILRYKLNLR